MVSHNQCFRFVSVMKHPPGTFDPLLEMKGLRIATTGNDKYFVTNKQVVSMALYTNMYCYQYECDL